MPGEDTSNAGGGDDANNEPVTQDEINSALASSGMVVPEATVTDNNLKDEGDDEEADGDLGDEAGEGSDDPADDGTADGSDTGADDGEGSDGADDGDEAADAGADDEAEGADKPADTPAADDAAADKFSFTVEDAEGQSYTIKAGDSLDDILADFTPKSTGQLMDIVKQQMRLEAEKEAYDEDQRIDAEAEERQANIKAIQDGWDSEIKQLAADKRIDADDKERVDAVYKFMGEVNAKREKAGQPLVNSFEDALDKLELKERRDAEAQAAKDAKEDKRKNGAMVGGSSAPATSGSPAYVAGSARNSTEALRKMGLL